MRLAGIRVGRVFAAAVSAAILITGVIGVLRGSKAQASGESVEITKWSDAYTFDNVPDFYMESFSTDASRYSLVPELSSSEAALSVQTEDLTGNPAIVIYKKGSQVPDINADNRIAGEGLESIADVHFTIKGNAVLTGTDGASYDFYYAVTAMSGFPLNTQSFTYLTLEKNRIGQNRINCVNMTVEFWVTEHGSEERIENLPWLYNNGVVAGEKWQLEWQEFCPALIAYVMKTATYSADETGVNTWLVGGKDKDMYSRMNVISFEDKQTWKFWKRYTVDGKQVTTTNGAATGRQSMAVSFHLAAPSVKAVYTSDDGGVITGKTSETRYLGNQTTTGTEHKINEGYSFSHWTANQEICLSEGTLVAAGDALTDEQIADALLIGNTTFTAVHKKNLSVRYEADEGGRITGIEEESVTEGDQPAGSESEPEEGYQFTSWTADHDVTTTDERTIPAGEALSDEDIKMIVVTEDLVITAHFDPLPVLAIDKEADKEKIDPAGDTVTYTLVIENTREGSKAEKMVITDTGIPGMTIDMDSVQADGIGDYEIESFEDGFKITCGEELAGGSHVTVTYSASVTDRAKLPGDEKEGGRTFANTASAIAEGMTEPVEDTHELAEYVPKLEIVKEADQTAVEVGDTVNYTVTVKQTQPSTSVTDVVIEDVLPDELVLDASSVTCSDTDAVIRSGNNAYTITLTALSETLTVRYSAQAVKTGDAVKNTAVATSRQTPDPEQNDAVVRVTEKTIAGSTGRVLKSTSTPLKKAVQAVKTGDAKSWFFALAAAAAVVIILTLFKKLLDRV